MVFKIIDGTESITAFLPILDKMLAGGLVCFEEVSTLHYGTSGPEADADVSAPIVARPAVEERGP